MFKEKYKIHFRNEPFMAVVKGRGDEPVKCTPVAGEIKSNCGVGIRFEDGKVQIWGLVHPRDLITAWRATEVLKHLNFINPNFTLCAAYYTALRNLSDDDRKRYAEPIITKIGRQTHRKIMSMPIPEKIIRAILDNQGHDCSPSLFPIEYEVKAGAIKWRPEFTDAMGDPDKDYAKEEARKKIISKFEPLLVSYAKFRDHPRHCIAMDDVERALLKLIKKGSDETHSNRVAVALAGAAADFIAFDFPENMELDPVGTHDAIYRSARWLTLSVLGKPRFFRKRAHLATASDFNKMIEELLLRLLEEYFPAAKQSPETIPA